MAAIAVVILTIAASKRKKQISPGNVLPQFLIDTCGIAISI